MTSDQQESDLNNTVTVQKPGAGLNPLADTFYSSKSLTAPAEKSWEPGEEFLTNGDLNLQDEVGGGFSSGDSPVSDSPPAPIMEGTLEAGAPPPEFVPDPTTVAVGAMAAAMPLVMGAETDSSLVVVGDGDLAEILVEQAGENVSPAEMSVTPDPLLNGCGEANTDLTDMGQSREHAEGSLSNPLAESCPSEVPCEPVDESCPSEVLYELVDESCPSETPCEPVAESCPSEVLCEPEAESCPSETPCEPVAKSCPSEELCEPAEGTVETPCEPAEGTVETPCEPVEGTVASTSDGTALKEDGPIDLSLAGYSGPVIDDPSEGHSADPVDLKALDRIQHLWALNPNAEEWYPSSYRQETGQINDPSIDPEYACTVDTSEKDDPREGPSSTGHSGPVIDAPASHSTDAIYLKNSWALHVDAKEWHPRSGPSVAADRDEDVDSSAGNSGSALNPMDRTFLGPFEPDGCQRDVAFGPDGYQRDVAFGPDGYQRDVAFGPDGYQRDAVFGPDGYQRDAVFGPDGYQRDAVFGPDGYQRDAVFELEGYQIEVAFGPEGYQIHVALGPEGYQMDVAFGPEGYQIDVALGPEGYQIHVVYGPEGYERHAAFGPEGYQTEAAFEPEGYQTDAAFGPEGYQTDAAFEPEGYQTDAAFGPDGLPEASAFGPDDTAPTAFGPYSYPVADAFETGDYHVADGCGISPMADACGRSGMVDACGMSPSVGGVVVVSGPGQPQQGCAEGGPAGAQAAEASSVSSAPSDLRSQLQTQLEYYFSRDNLIQDHYLQSQMDGDQYVPITTIANFNQVVKLTTNYNFIVDVLQNSKVVQVDDSGTKVRPRLNRTVLMLREIPENTPKEEVEALFQDERCPRLVHCEFAHNGYWYITFTTDDDAASAFCFLRERNIMFRNKPVLARIKARPLVRPGGGGHYMSKTPPQPQQDGCGAPFLRQQQAQFPIMASAVPQFVNQQQVPQPVSPFHLYNLQTMMPQWPNTPAHTFMDPGAMLTLNGLQATAVKPSTNHSRNIYHHPVRTNNRGMGKPHQRPQSISTDKVQESRGGSMDHRPHNTSHLSTRSSPRNNTSHSHHQHHAPPLESLSTQPPPFARSRSEGSGAGGNNSSSGSSHNNTSHHQPSGVSSAPVPLVPPHEDTVHLPAQPSGARADTVSTAVQHKRSNYRKSRRNDEGAKNSRMNSNHGGKDGKVHEPHFELEATYFPPLPGSSNNSSSGDAPEGSKLSDVVKGTTRSGSSRLEDRVKASPAPSLGSNAPAPVSASTAVSTTPSHVSVTDTAPSTAFTSTIAASPLTAAATSPAVAKETEAVANGNQSSSPHVRPAATNTTTSTSTITSATAVESSAHTSTIKTSKTSSQSSPATKSSMESSVTPKQGTISTTSVKTTYLPSPSPATDAAPARLSYAQMVARKQQAENVARQSTEEGAAAQQANATAPAAARTPAQTTLREQSQTQASASVSASAPPKSASASASARPPSKEGAPRKDFEPKEPRFPGGGRGAKENRNSSRQPRFERRRGERDVKVPAK